MIDNRLLPVVEFFFQPIASYLVAKKVKANSITFVGFLIGIASIPLITFGFFKLALLAIIFNRVFDGLDGIVARKSGISDSGAFLDISLDFIFYASIPLAFALYDPINNSIFAVVLLFSFFGSGSTFFAFSLIAERKNLSSELYPTKGIYYLGGLIEGAETIIFLLVICIFPNYFPFLASIFSFLCIVSAILRLKFGWSAFD